MTNAYVLATDSNVARLIELGNSVGKVIAVNFSENGCAQASSNMHISLADAPIEAAAGILSELIANDSEAGVVLAPNTSSGRVLAGAVAARLKAPILAGVKELNDSSVTVSRFGGITTQTFAVPASVLVLVSDGGAEVELGDSGPEVGKDLFKIRVTGTSQSEFKSVNLSAAKRIVAVGRGFKTKDDLQIANDLASALGAEIACSRPVAEGNGWLPRDRYVGISGQCVAPDLYFAVGISGQIQHVAGMGDSGIVVAVNNDSNASIFKYADYGIVGDLYQILPSISAALK